MVPGFYWHWVGSSHRTSIDGRFDRCRRQVVAVRKCVLEGRRVTRVIGERAAEGGSVRRPEVDDLPRLDGYAGRGRAVFAPQRNRARQCELCRPAARDDTGFDRAQVRLGAAVLHARSELDLQLDSSPDAFYAAEERMGRLEAEVMPRARG